MKKGLLATSALVGASLLGAPAMAATPTIADNLKLTITGNIRTTLIIYNNNDTNGGAYDGTGHNFRGVEESEITFQASATAANGLAYGFQIEVQTQNDDTNNADEAWMYIDSQTTFGRIELGDQDDAADRMMVDGADAQAGRGGSLYGVATGEMIAQTRLAGVDSASITRSGDASKLIYFTPRYSGLQLGFSFTPDTGADGGEVKAAIGTDFADVWGFGANYTNKYGDATVTVAATYQAGRNENAGILADLNIWGVGGKVEQSGFAFAAGYANSGDTGRSVAAAATGANGGNWWNAGLMYTTGPWDFSIGYFSGVADNGTIIGKNSTATQAAIAATYRMAPGWVLASDVVVFSYKNRGPAATAGVWTPVLNSNSDGWLLVMSSTMTF